MGGEWREFVLSEALAINPPVRLKRGKTYPFVSMEAVEPDCHWIEPDEAREFNGGGARFRDGDTLMARITPSLEHGKIIRFRGTSENPVGFGSTEFIVFRARPDITTPEFAYYLIKSPRVHRYAISQMTGTSGRQRVPVDSLKHLEISLPPLPEQRAIAHILGTLDDRIELNRRISETLQQMARALFKSWFVDFDPVIENALAAGNPIPDALAEKAAHRQALGNRRKPLPEHLRHLFPDRFVESEASEMRWIPEGWEVKSLDQIAEYMNGIAWQRFRADDNEPSLPVIKIRELRDGTSDSSDRARMATPREFHIADGDVIFSWSGTLMIKLWCGGRGILNQHLFKVSSAHYPKWFYYLWTSHHINRFRRIAADKTTTMGHIKRSHLAEAHALVPPGNLLGLMTDMMMPIIEEQVVKEIESRTLAALRDALLPRLISGQIHVDPSRILEAHD